jgi:phage baseplate assembly protein gpV
MDSLFGRWFEGVIDIYDESSRTCTVKIPRFTDGAEEGLQADIAFTIGDNSKNTSILINSGDKVWVQFINGNADTPIVVAFRNVKKGNKVGERYWKSPKFVLDGDVEITGSVTINGDSVKHSGTEIGKTHKHGAGTLKDSQSKPCSGNTDGVS